MGETFIFNKEIIVKEFINIENKDLREHKYIVIHEISSSPFKRKNGESLHYIVSDKKITNLVDLKKETVHLKVESNIKNNNSISIAYILEDDADIEKLFMNLVNIVKYVSDKYQISIKNIIRYTDISKFSGFTELTNSYVWHNFKCILSGINSKEFPVAIGKLKDNTSFLPLNDKPSKTSIIIDRVSTKNCVYIYAATKNWYKVIAEGENFMREGYLGREFIDIKRVSKKDLLEG